MKRLTRFQENISVRKATNYAIIINSLEILLILGVMALVVISPQYDFSPRMMRLLVGVAAAVIIWGAVMDIREAMSTRRLLSQLDAMDDTIDAMEKLNNTLRAQRHDFLNHLQVVYSLMEMEEYGEANSYIEKVYGRITAVSRVLKTASAPINALLQVKLAACEKAGVQVTLNITSTWKELPISGWEMCKVLSNLIDNAIDAMADLPNGKKHLTITLTENLKEYVFSVANTGTPIAPDDQQRIFEPGVTTKSDGHGMGLFIVRETLRQLCRRPELAAGEPEVLGPAPAPVVKVNNRFRYRCTLVGKNDKATREMLAWLQKDFAKDSANRGMNLFVDHNAAD